MKVLQTIPYMLASQGGPSTCTCDLLQGIYEVNGQVDLLTSRPQTGSKEVMLGGESPWIKTIECDYKTPLALSNAIDQYLKDNDYDIYHANTLWLYPVHATCEHARKTGKPYILSPHGMLYPTALAISAWKKKIMRKMWFDKDIMNATCIHATCKQEAKHVRAFGYKGPIAVIPNAVVVPQCLKGVKDMSNVVVAEGETYINTKQGADNEGYRTNSKITIGFLGRLHPIKKVENVLYAMDKIRARGFNVRETLCFQIMGKYDEQYEQWLKDEVRRLHLDDCVEFLGFVSGAEKYNRLSKLSALMVPSAQENFGMIVPEALICGTPVYASQGTPWGELNDFNAGWWSENSPENIAEVILDILSKPNHELRTMGYNGRKLIQEKYEQHKVADMMLNLYGWIKGEASKPEFVYVNEIL